MIGLKLLGNENAELIDVNIPKPKKGYVLLKMKTMALCGSDINLRYRPSYENGKKMLNELGISYNPNSIPGHEITGCVVENHSSNSRLKKDDNVFIFPFIPSKDSVFYEDRLWKYCKPLKIIGYTIDGGNSEYLSVPEGNCYKFPDYVSLNQAAMLLDPIGAPYGIIKKLNVNYLDRVLILGVGPIGLGATTICKYIGVKEIIVVDKVKERVDIAGSLGANHLLNMDKNECEKEVLKLTDDKGPNVVIDCIGDNESLNQALKLVKPQGKIGVIGEPGFINNVSVSDLIIHKDLTITGSWVYDPQKLKDLFLLLKNGLKIENIITHTFPIDESLKAWELFNTGKTGKIVICQN